MTITLEEIADIEKLYNDELKTEILSKDIKINCETQDSSICIAQGGYHRSIDASFAISVHCLINKIPAGATVRRYGVFYDSHGSRVEKRHVTYSFVDILVEK
jgi:hypothetical protein